MLIANEQSRQRILSVALIFVSVTIPLFNNLNSIALILLVAACLLQRPVREWRPALSHSMFWWLPVIYFLWISLTWFWDTSGGFTIKHLERYAILLFLPPAIALTPRIPAKYIRQTCLAMVAVTVVVCVICLIRSYLEFRVSGDSRLFFYHYLAQQMKLNAIFLSNYCLASIVWLLYYGFMQERKISLLPKIVTVCMVLFLLAMTLLLSSKLIIILTIAALAFCLLYIGYLNRRFLLTALIMMAGVFIIAFFAVDKLGYVKWRFATTELKKYGGPEDVNNGVAIRLLMWETGWDLIRERPLTGHGLKGARDETLEQYRKKDFKLGYEEKYHTHNQYIESALMGGIPALILLLAILTMAAVRAVRQRNLLLGILTIHFAIQSVIESTFEVQQELVFFLFFIFLFYYHPPLRTNKS